MIFTKVNEFLSDLDVLTEILPCGIDPIGVFVLDQFQEMVDEGCVQRLVEQLPEAFLDVTDPVVLTRNSAGLLQCFIFAEGQLQEAEWVAADQEAMEEEVQTVRIRGSMAVVARQSEGDIQNAFQHLIEKVRKKSISWEKDHCSFGLITGLVSVRHVPP